MPLCDQKIEKRGVSVIMAHLGISVKFLNVTWEFL